MLHTNALFRRRSPSWGAWIETIRIFGRTLPIMVAPPRGERGLKPCSARLCYLGEKGRSPAWIETEVWESSSRKAGVAPPRGERGLKPFDSYIIIPYRWVAPPRGERGLKQASKRMGSRKK